MPLHAAPIFWTSAHRSVSVPRFPAAHSAPAPVFFRKSRSPLRSRSLVFRPAPLRFPLRLFLRRNCCHSSPIHSYYNMNNCQCLNRKKEATLFPFRVRQLSNDCNFLARIFLRLYKVPGNSLLLTLFLGEAND
jgi:hypothetical protein